MKSSTFGYRTLQVIGVLIMIMVFPLIYEYFFPGSDYANVDLGDGGLKAHLMFWCFNLLVVLLGATLFFKASFVQLSHEEFKIESFMRNEALLWKDIRNVRKIPLVSPPLYRVSVFGAKPGYFTMGNARSWEVETPYSVHSGDNSGVLKYSKQRINAAKTPDERL